MCLSDFANIIRSNLTRKNYFQKIRLCWVVSHVMEWTPNIFDNMQYQVQMEKRFFFVRIGFTNIMRSNPTRTNYFQIIRLCWLVPHVMEGTQNYLDNMQYHVQTEKRKTGFAKIIRSNPTRTNNFQVYIIMLTCTLCGRMNTKHFWHNARYCYFDLKYAKGCIKTLLYIFVSF
jgi:hypothetical protein